MDRRSLLIRLGVSGASSVTVLPLILGSQSLPDDGLQRFADRIYQAKKPDDIPNILPRLAPSPAWTGIPASGFETAIVDPQRNTAKPAIRLIVPPNQAYSDELLVGVYAGANDHGSLLANMGLEKIIAHYEGNAVTIAEPTFETFDDANGHPVTYFGWWMKLKHDGRNGHANLYFEAVPRDPSMQHRVIGPYQFSPQEVLHDAELTVAASGAVTAGTSYQTLHQALDYCRSTAKDNPLITIIEAGDYDLSPMWWSYHGENYATITATAPVTITNAPSTATNASFRTKYNGMHFKGSNITIDFVNARSLYAEIVPREHWLDGCNLTCSAGRDALLNLGPRDLTGYLIRNRAYFTECTITNVYRPCQDASLARGNTISTCWSDVFTGAVCTVANRIHDHDSRFFSEEIDALVVSYAGEEANATLALAGANSAKTRTFTAKWGANSASLTVHNTEAAFLADSNYTVQNVADWLNSLTGWTASMVDGSRRATALSIGRIQGAAFPDMDVKTAPIALITMFDIHADLVQLSSAQNVIVADNVLTAGVCQNIFLKNGRFEDILIVNNAFHNLDGGGQYSQFSHDHSHVVVAHNSWSQQGFMLRGDVSYAPDNYCLIAKNTMPSLRWIKTATAELKIADNHLHEGATAPMYATGTTAGGDGTNLFGDAASGDFYPAGELKWTRTEPVMQFDSIGNRRNRRAPTGAMIFPKRNYRNQASAGPGAIGLESL